MKNISLEFIKYFLVIGLLGSFTTFSTFSYEVVDLLNSTPKTVDALMKLDMPAGVDIEIRT